MEGLEKLNGDLEIKQNPKHSLLFKILFAALVLISVALIVVVIILATKDNNSSDNQESQDSSIPKGDEGNNDNKKQVEPSEMEKAGYSESWNILFGERLENLSYVDGDTITNSFKNGATNYKEDIGIINEGNDYTKTDLNIYTLYIPKEALNKKDKHNGIFLFIHGANERKEDIEHYCKRYAKYGYITATMDHNELYRGSPSSNIFRIMDEINSCITSIKNKLVQDYKFDGDKLEIAICGFSLGSYISMLYGYSMKNSSPIPIKFIINISGFLDQEPNYWYKLAEGKETLASIEPASIIEGINNGNLVKFYDNEQFYLQQINFFFANRYTNEEIMQMLDNNKNINYESQKYKELYKSAKYIFVTYHINNTRDDELIPILCEYAGNDSYVGVAQYKHLKEMQEKRPSLKFDLVYMRYARHYLINYDTENGINAMRDMHQMIMKYAETYFTSENYEEEQREKRMAAGGYREPWNVLFGIKLENVSYATNGTIKNSFRLGGDNYNAEIGEMNNGKDYDENQWNKYTLYIPTTALKNNKGYNAIIIYLHGTKNTKEDMDHHSSRYAKLGYITATFDYNERGNNNDTNNFRALDEITAGIEHIKQKLINDYGFDGSKLELAINGFSFGSYLTMLYGYSIAEKSSIPIKFLINLSGFLDFDNKYYYKVANISKTLSDIEPQSIDEGVKNGSLVRLYPNDFPILTHLNYYIGSKYTDNEIRQMLYPNLTINYESDLYKEFYKTAKYCLVSHYIKEKGEKGEQLLPILCEYGGNDVTAGIGQFRLLRELSNKYGIEMDMIYMKYGAHSLMGDGTEIGTQAMRDIHYNILQYAKKYFTMNNQL